MLDHAERAIRFAHGKTRGDLDTDEQFQYAIRACLTVIGEAASQISEPTRAKFASIPFSQIIGMRNWLVHGYHSLNNDIIWSTIMQDLPALAEEILKSIPPESP